MTKSHSLPRQTTLDLGHIPEVRLNTFIPTGNESLIGALQALESSWEEASHLTPRVPNIDQRLIHAWGASGSGRSHILLAMLTKANDLHMPAFLLNQNSTPDEWRAASTELENLSEKVTLLCVDDVDYLDEFSQGALFRIHNLIKDSPRQVLITTSSLPPASLRLRDDLRTRLAWGLVFQMHTLSDVEKLNALEKAASARGLNLSSDVAPWLLRHFHRDMPSLMALLEAIDVYSLETKRAVTLPLVKEMLSPKN